MFFDSNNKPSPALVILLALSVVAVIVAVAVFLFSLLIPFEKTKLTKNKKVNNEAAKSEVISNEKGKKPQNSTALDNEKIKEEYKSKIKDLAIKLNKDKLNNAQKLDKVQEFLFTVKVPKQYLDNHLQTAIEFRKKRENLNTKENISKQLTKMVKNILDQ